MYWLWLSKLIETTVFKNIINPYSIHYLLSNSTFFVSGISLIFYSVLLYTAQNNQEKVCGILSFCLTGAIRFASLEKISVSTSTWCLEYSSNLQKRRIILVGIYCILDTFNIYRVHLAHFIKLLIVLFLDRTDFKNRKSKDFRLTDYYVALQSANALHERHRSGLYHDSEDWGG